MSAQVPIRRAGAADAAGILALEALFPGDRMSARSVRAFIASPRAEVRVAVEGGAVVGALVLLTRRDSRAGRIYSVAVSPAMRGRGVGSRLVGAAERAAKARGLEAVTLEVRADNASARAMYDKLGYVLDRELPVYYDDGAPGLRLRRDLGARR